MTLTAEQLVARRSRVGSSDMAAILGMPIFKGVNAHKIWLDKCDMLEPEDESKKPWLGKGNYLEPVILDYAQGELGPLARNVEVWDPQGAPIASTLDAQVIADGRPVEAKTSGIYGPVHGNWGEAGTDEIPDGYLVQAQVHLLCTGKDLCPLFAMLPGRWIVTFNIEPHPALQTTIRNVATDFLERYVTPRVDPRTDWADRLKNVHGVTLLSDPCEPQLEVVKRIRRVPNKIIHAADVPGLHDKLAAWNLANEAAKKAGKEEEQKKAELLAAIGDAEALDFGDTKKWLTYFKQSRTGIDTKALKAAHPDIAQRFSSTSEYRVLRMANKP